MTTFEAHKAEYEGLGLRNLWAEAFAGIITRTQNPPEHLKAAWPIMLERLLGTISLNIFQIIEAGYTIEDIFGCDPHNPCGRYDRMGLLMLIGGCTITAVAPEGITLKSDKTGAILVFRVKNNQREGRALLWQI